jgi:uncharacterized membrane protein
MRLFTYVLTTGSIEISNTDGVTAFTVQANSSSACTIEGNIPFKGLSSTAVTLENGESYTQTTTPNSTLDGITITWVSGTIDILISI